jgi:parallel beta-helix repeat protein
MNHRTIAVCALVIIGTALCAITGSHYSHVNLAHGGPWVDIREYGAVADCGVTFGSSSVTGTDNAVACRNSLAASHSIIIPKGIFRIDSGLLIASGTTIRGSGKESSFLVYTGTDSAIYTAGGAILTQFVTISDLTIICSNITATNATALKLHGFVHGSLKDVRLHGNTTSRGAGIRSRGVELVNAYMNNFRTVDCRYFYEGFVAESQSAGYAGDLVIDGQGEFQNNDFGIVFGNPSEVTTSGGNCTVRDCTIESNTNTGLSLYNMTGHTIDGCWFEKNSVQDVLIGSAGSLVQPYNVLIQRNLLTSSLSPVKVELRQGWNITLRDNRISRVVAPYSPGVRLPATCAANVSYLYFDHNQAHNTADWGINSSSTYPLSVPVFNCPALGPGNTPWTDVATFVASFSNIPGYQQAQYRRIRTLPSHRYLVEVRGTVSGLGLPATPAVVFTLPASHTPPARIDLDGYGWSGYVLASGDVVVANQEFSSHGLYFSFDPDL